MFQTSAGRGNSASAANAADNFAAANRKRQPNSFTTTTAAAENSALNDGFQMLRCVLLRGGVVSGGAEERLKSRRWAARLPVESLNGMRRRLRSAAVLL